MSEKEKNSLKASLRSLLCSGRRRADAHQTCCAVFSLLRRMAESYKKLGFLKKYVNSRPKLLKKKPKKGRMGVIENNSG